jgi:ABC-type transport system involved in multi-copper enzyme maturation permease subunit
LLTKILRFEWRYHTRQISFAAAALLFGAFGFALTATGFGPANVNINSPYSITQSLGLLSLAAVFAIAVFCANSVVRDREHQFEEIVFSTSVEKFPYLFGRFAGSFLAAFTAFSATAVGMMIAVFMPWQDAARVGPFSLIPYLWTLLVLVLPGMLVAAVTLFGIATLTRSTLASVVGAVAIYIFYFAAAAFTNSPLMAASAPGASSAAGASLLDPFGLSAFFEQTAYWTPLMRNTRLVALSGNFLINRILWLTFSAIVWIVVYKRFSFRLLTKAKGSTAVDDEVAPPTTTYAPESVSPSWRALISATRIEVRSVLRSIPFILLTILWAGLAAMQILSDVNGGEYGAAFYPSIGLILNSIRQPLSLVATVIIIYYSAELIWRERAVGMAEILNATPAASGVFVLSKWIALCSMIAVLVAGGIGVGVVIQLIRGDFQPGSMLALAGILAIPLMIFAMAAVLIQTLSPSKYTGLLFVLVAGVYVQAGTSLGIEHPLLIFANAPPLQFTEMNGFVASSFLWFMALWTSLGALFLLAAAARWRREKLRRTPAIILAALVLTIGAFIFYNTNILNRWTSRAASLAWATDYEKTYRAAATLPRPHIAAINADIALFPRTRRFYVNGSYTLVNDGTSPIASVLVSIPRDARAAKLSLSNAKLTRHDERFATYTFHFDHPLQPHERAALQFDITYEKRGFTATTPDNSIATNGSFITAGRSLPVLGYRRGYEINDPSERKKRGLPPDPNAGDDDLAAEWTAIDVTLSTERDQIALAPGRLTKEWSAGGRRYFHYQSASPIHNNLIFASARYAVASAGNVTVYYHPDHRANVASILTAATRSLREFETSFGPYPQSQLRIAEAPGYWQFGGLAMPGLVFLSESRAFLIDARDPSRIDLITRRTAHEVSHQWWGHHVTPAVVPGASTIIESLPRYSELLVLAKRGDVRRSLGFELDRYLAGRTADRNPEVPLTRVTDQAYLYYGKGAIVMNALKHLLGEETLNRALRNFIAMQGGSDRQPVIDDLLRSIRDVTPPQYQSLADEWTRDVVLYDLSMTSSTSRRLPDGRFEITMQVIAHKSRGEHELPMSEPIEIGLFAVDPDDAEGKDVIHLAAHTVNSGVNTITVIVDKEPSFAAIDPYITRIDRNRFDNTRPVIPSRRDASAPSRRLGMTER